MKDEHVEVSPFRRAIRTLDRWIGYTAYPIVAGLIALPVYWLYCLLVDTDPVIRLLKYAVLLVCAPIAAWFLLVFLVSVPFRALGGLIDMMRPDPPEPPPAEPDPNREPFMARLARMRLEREEAARREE